MTISRRGLLTTGSVASLGLLTGCTTTTSSIIDIKDGWTKATTSESTATFGTLHNNTNKEVIVMSATSTLTPTVQLHTTVTDESGATSMKQDTEGFAIPANGTYVLKPGGAHIMYMQLAHRVSAGQKVDTALKLKDGRTVNITTIARDYSGANENYNN